VNAIQHQQRQRQQPPHARRETVKRKCYYCGLDYPHKNNSCPAYARFVRVKNARFVIR
jgi:hypothetical protein